MGAARRAIAGSAFQGERLKTTTGHGLRPNKSRRRQLPSVAHWRAIGVKLRVPCGFPLRGQLREMPRQIQCGREWPTVDPKASGLDELVVYDIKSEPLGKPCSDILAERARVIAITAMVTSWNEFLKARPLCS